MTIDQSRGPRYNDTIGDALERGSPIADDGNMYDSVQQAIDNSSAWTFIPPGDYSSSGITASINTGGFSLVGSGRGSNEGTVLSTSGSNTVIDVAGVSDVTIKSMAIQGGTVPILIDPGSTNSLVRDIKTSGVEDGPSISGDYSFIKNLNSDATTTSLSSGLQGSTEYSTIVGCTFRDSNGNGADAFSNSTMSGCIVDNAASTGIVGFSQGIVTGNRIHNVDVGIETADGGVYTSNIITSATTTAIDDVGTGTVVNNNN